MRIGVFTMAAMATMAFVFGQSDSVFAVRLSLYLYNITVSPFLLKNLLICSILILIVRQILISLSS